VRALHEEAQFDPCGDFDEFVAGETRFEEV